METIEMETEEDLLAAIDILHEQEHEITNRLCRFGCLSVAKSRDSVRPVFRGPPSEKRLKDKEDPELGNIARRLFRNALGLGPLIKPKKELSNSEPGSSSHEKVEEQKEHEASVHDDEQQQIVQEMITDLKLEKEDVKLLHSEACKPGSISQEKVEQEEHAGSAHDDEQQTGIEVQMMTDLNFRARYANMAEEKISKLLFLHLSEHQKKLGNFLRTKAKPPIYYSFAKQLEDPTLLEERKNLALQEWKAIKETELLEYLEEIKAENVTNIPKHYQSWLDGRKVVDTGDNFGPQDQTCASK